ncbi:hypothetical protein YC2023_095035 [Brassica napus]
MNSCCLAYQKELLKETMPKHKAVLIWYFIYSEECSSLIDGVDVFVNFKVRSWCWKETSLPLHCFLLKTVNCFK